MHCAYDCLGNAWLGFFKLERDILRANTPRSFDVSARCIHDFHCGFADFLLLLLLRPRWKAWIQVEFFPILRPATKEGVLISATRVGELIPVRA